MRCLVTGSEGTLGRKLVTELEQRGHDVWGCDLMHSSREQYTRADIAEAGQVERVFQWEPEICYNLAAEFGRMNGEEYAAQLWKTNLIGNQNIIDSCIRHNTHLVFASSSEVYGTLSDGSDMKEELLKSKPPTFHNCYALSKWANEHQINIAIANRGLRATILRLFNAWGEGEMYSPYRSVVCLFAFRLWKGLPITVYKGYHRTFMHQADWAQTVANVAERLTYLHNGDVFNVGGRNYASVESLKDLIVTVLGGTQSQITYLTKEAANVQNKRPNIDRAQLHLGHDPRITLEQGMSSYIKWLQRTHG